MVDIVLLLSFFATAILLTLMPGPDILFVIAQSISQNKKAGIMTSLGLCTGLMIHIAAATLGVSAMIYQSAFAFSIVKYLGVAYLFYLAWQSLKEKEANLTMSNQKKLNYHLLYKKGILMNILNPKVSLFFLALLPQFVDKSAGNISVQMLILGIIFLVQAFGVFSIISIFSDKISVFLLHKPFIATRINVIKGSLLAIIGLQIAFSEK